MSPLTLQIIIHYCVRAVDYRDGDLSAPAVKQVIAYLENEEMIRKVTKDDDNCFHTMKYVGTTKARYYLDYICKIPFPVNDFKIPEED